MTYKAFEPTVYWKDVEIYDPAANQWFFTAPLSVPRAYHGAVRLLDGRVLVVAGYTITQNGGGIALGSAELYYPAAQAWVNTSPMGSVKGTPRVALLPDGRVLAVAGPDAELFDPVTATWAPTGAPVVARDNPGAAALADGRVLFAGGLPAGVAGAEPLASAEIYDPSTGMFAAVGSLSVARVGPLTVALADGRALVAGGADKDGPFDTAEVFDPSTGTFQLVQPMTRARFRAAGARMEDGTVLVTGGYAPNTYESFFLSEIEVTSTTERFDPVTGAWKAWFPMTEIRALHTLSPLPGGQWIAVGGHWEQGVGGDSFFVLSSTDLTAAPGVATRPRTALRACRCWSAERALHRRSLLQDGMLRRVPGLLRGLQGTPGECAPLDGTPCGSAPATSTSA
ncbi:MAG: kelch repeat-containing protein [Polyangiaceae bacterium]